MLDVLAEPPRAKRLPVPWHCQSRATRLIERVAAGDVELAKTIRDITTRLMPRARRKPYSPIRREDAIDLERDWRERLNTETRLGFVCDQLPKGLMISDCRATVLDFAFGDWPAGHKERGLLLVLIRLRLARNDIGLTVDRLAFISAHALGRCFERAPDIDEAALMEGMRRLVIEHDNLTLRTPFHCRVPGGWWVGDITRLKGQPNPALAVRTFLEPKELER
jgi:hypothetical protein